MNHAINHSPIDNSISFKIREKMREREREEGIFVNVQYMKVEICEKLVPRNQQLA